MFVRRKCLYLFFGRRNITYLTTLVLLSLVALYGCWLLAEVGSRVLLPPEPPDQNLNHFRRSRSLEHYLSNIQLLIEPSSVECQDTQVPVVVMVSSSPSRAQRRQAIRETWGRRLPTFFVLGLFGSSIDEEMVDNYIEAKQYRDMVVYEFKDHYQNLTLKSALMLQWARERCPFAKFVMKTDDDVMLNPWTLNQVLEDHGDAQLIGHRRAGAVVHRDEYNKWYMPRWLCPDDVIPQYLDGTAYIIKGIHVKPILEAAKKVPLVNLEDVYFTYFVSQKALGLNLTDDHRLSPFKPWLSIGCAYFRQASVHSLDPTEMLNAWAKLYKIAKEFETDKRVCSYFDRYVSNDMLLY